MGARLAVALGLCRAVWRVLVRSARTRRLTTARTHTLPHLPPAPPQVGEEPEDTVGLKSGSRGGGRGGGGRGRGGRGRGGSRGGGGRGGRGGGGRGGGPKMTVRVKGGGGFRK